MILLLLSCNSDPNPEILNVVCEPETIDYESVAEPFLQNYCTGCHSSHLEEGKRFGAPETVNLDTYSSAKEWAERSFIRISIHEDMPPGGGVSQKEKDQFTQWAFCGLKGNEVDRYISSPPPQHESHLVGIEIKASELGEDVLSINRFIEVGGTDLSRFGSYSEEFYQFHENGANFLGYILYSAPERTAQEVFYDPPLPVLHYEEMEANIETLATIWEAGEERQEWQEWSGSQTFPTWLEIDPHERDREPLESIWISDAGEERGWHFSQTVILPAQWWFREDEYFINIQQFSGINLLEPREYFELTLNDGWFEMMIEEGNP